MTKPQLPIPIYKCLNHSLPLYTLSFLGVILQMVLLLGILTQPVTWAVEDPPKMKSVLFPKELITIANRNAAQYSWAKEIQDTLVQRAKPWLETEDDQLWQMMFGPGITRTWMVWSDGYCPSCKKDVRMYTWKIDVWNHPFKVQCPHCESLFPTNEFASYYHSGLTPEGLFDPAQADKKLLYNQAHPDPNDPLHQFGVDDGEGYLNDGHTWRFIGYYLIAGQWRTLVVGGVRALAEAYGATGDLRYAHKAAILLDRVADLYPRFDFSKDGLVYEKGGHRGAVTVWHDACEEVRELAQAYDLVFDALPNDSLLVPFLSAKATQSRVPLPKENVKDICRNIEERILKETLAHPDRIESNYPRTPVALMTIEAVLGFPENREQVMARFEEILKESLKEDGMTGEKGLAGYSTIFPRAFATVAMRFERAEPGFLKNLFTQYPDLYKTYRFHLDTWCLQKYYPMIGDSGCFGMPAPTYCAVDFARSSLEPSMYTFLYHLYENAGDQDFVKVLYKANNDSVENLPHDLFYDNPTQFQEQVAALIGQSGAIINPGDVNKEEWGISLLRSGQEKEERVLWIDHDAGGRHGHRGGLNIGLFAKGLDLLPDFGYPPVGYGGWNAPKAVWYIKTASHNTVVVDGNDHQSGKGKTTLWVNAPGFDVVRVSAPELIGGTTFERTVMLIDHAPSDSYVVDLFRVCGGTEHAAFLSAFYGNLQAAGLSFTSTEEYGYQTETRSFRTDPQPTPGWSVDWTIDDRFKQATTQATVHLRQTNLTQGASVGIGEGWIVGGMYGGQEEWIPRVLVRRRAEQAPLSSLFCSVLEPYEQSARIAQITRVTPTHQGAVIPEMEAAGLSVSLENGPSHLIAVDWKATSSPDRLVSLKNTGLSFHGEIAFVIDSHNTHQLILCNGDFIQYAGHQFKTKQVVPYLCCEVSENTVVLKDNHNQTLNAEELLE